MTDTARAASRPAERAAAADRRAAYPYRFPCDERRLGGAFSVEDNARRLQRWFYLERRLAQGLGSWTLAIPDFEVKVEIGRHIFWHADAARELRARLHEQEMRLDAIDGLRDADVDRLIDELLSAADAPELLVGHLLVAEALAMSYRHHIDLTCPVADAPTIRALRRVLLDHEPMIAWTRAAIAAYVAGGVDESRVQSWRWHLARLLGSIGGTTGAEPRTPPPAPLRSDGRPYQRGTAPRRDARFRAFANTGDYDVADGEPRFPAGYDAERLIFIRTQRDEVDAIEAFGTFLWDIRFRGFAAEHDLARITWDESRHTEMGHRAMLASGYDPFELPNRLTPSTCRGPMTDPAVPMAEINLFGEVAVLKTIHGLIGRARERGDALLEHIAGYVRSDERTHVRMGRGILRCMTDMDMPTLELRTREAFTRCLVELGAMKPGEPGFVLSREDIEHLVGE